MFEARSILFAKLILRSKVPDFVWNLKDFCAKVEASRTEKLPDTAQSASGLSSATLEKIKLSAFAMKANKKKTGFEKGLRILAYCASVMITLTTTFALILPAIALETDEDPVVSNSHTHSAECYTKIASEKETPSHLACTSETAGVHSHTTDCYNENGLRICGLATFVVHTHNEKCYEDNVLVCTLPVIKEHTHDSSCYVSTRGELKCELEETSGHSHELSCYDAEGNLICETAESTGHTHSDDCYEITYTFSCDKTEIILHTHSAACYDEDNNIICGKLEVRSHIHSDACFESIDEETDPLTCTIAESEAHYHSLECYGADGSVICGKQEGDGHTHSDMCYGTWVLTCGKVSSSDKAVQPEEAVSGSDITVSESDIVLSNSDAVVSESDTVISGSDIIVSGSDIVSNSDLIVSESDVLSGSDLVSDSDCKDDTVRILVCKLAESSGHTHSLDCFDENGNVLCGIEESTGHTHNEDCYLIGSPLCEKEEHIHSAACHNSNGELICDTEEHTHFALCIDPRTRLHCWQDEHRHNESCTDENGRLVCELFEHTHVAGCCDFLSAMMVMIELLPTAEEAENVLLAYEETEDWDSFVVYQQKVAALAWRLQYAYEELTEEEQALITNYSRLEDIAWLWAAAGFAADLSKVTYNPDYETDDYHTQWTTPGTYITQSTDSRVHINETVPDEYTIDGIIIGEKSAESVYASFTPMFSSVPSEAEAEAATGYNWTTLANTGIDCTLGANLILPSEAEAKATLLASGVYAYYSNIGTYDEHNIDLKISLVDYENFVDWKNNRVKEGFLGFWTTDTRSDQATYGQILPGISVCGISWVRVLYTFYDHDTGEKIDVKGSTSFYDVDFAQAIHIRAGDTKLKGIYVTNVNSLVPNLDEVNSYTTRAAQRAYFENWAVDDCVLKFSAAPPSGWSGVVVYSPHGNDSGSDTEQYEDTKHAFTVAFERNSINIVYSFDKGKFALTSNSTPEKPAYSRNANGGIFHTATPIPTGTLEIQKVVTGSAVDPNREFTFKIEFFKTGTTPDKTLDGTYGDVTLVDGVGTFTLKDGESVEISNIHIRQYGTPYRITELGYDGYTVNTSMTSQVKGGTLTTDGPYFSDQYSGTLTADAGMDQHQIVVFENFGGVELPHTGGAGFETYIICGMMLTSFALFVLMHKKRRELLCER